MSGSWRRRKKESKERSRRVELFLIFPLSMLFLSSCYPQCAEPSPQRAIKTLLPFSLLHFTSISPSHSTSKALILILF